MPHRATTSVPSQWLHGFACLPSMWDEVASKPTTARPLPGHGHRPPSASGDFMDVAAELATEAASPRHLVGYSMGARLALAMAISQPEACASLLLIGATAGLADHERADRRAWEEANARRLERHGIEHFIDQWEALPLFETQQRLPTEVRQRIRQDRLAHDAAGLAWAMRVLGSGNMPSMWDRLPELQVPTRILCGELDAKYVQFAGRMATLVPNATVRIVPAVGHNVVAEAPSVVTAEAADVQRAFGP